MYFTVSLYIASFIFGWGLIYKISTWFSCRLTGNAGDISTGGRFLAALTGILSVLSDKKKVLTLAETFVFDVLLQKKLLQQNRLRWAIHMLIFSGISFLIFLHALDELITAKLFPDYYATLNPFLFLRNLFGAMVVLGLLLAIGRRYRSKSHRLMPNVMDRFILLLLSLIIMSGFLLEAVEITSSSEFMTMVTDYAGLDPESDAEEIAGLEAYWVKHYGLISLNPAGSATSDLLEQGRQSNGMYCIQCHSDAKWAFISYGVSRTLAPIALELDRVKFSEILVYLHFLSVLIALAYLPFSKMFHFFVSPLILLVNAVMDEKSDPANVATRQMMELDACVHCGICNARCSVAGSFGAIKNAYIMPSEKIAALKSFVVGTKIDKTEIRAIQNGLFFCTNCRHCSDVCPININLQALWSNVREEFLQKGYPEFFLLSPLSIHRVIKKVETPAENYWKPLTSLTQAIAEDFNRARTSMVPLKITRLNPTLRCNLTQSFQGRTCSTCFTCMTCSSICPVVEMYPTPLDELGLLPHQIIHAANLGHFELAFSAKMLWCCLGCYECQENCPQEVRITDIFYELKNMAITHFEEKVFA